MLEQGRCRLPAPDRENDISSKGLERPRCFVGWSYFFGTRCCSHESPGGDPIRPIRDSQIRLLSRRASGHLLRLQGQEWQKLLNVGHAFQRVDPLYHGLGPG